MVELDIEGHVGAVELVGRGIGATSWVKSVISRKNFFLGLETLSKLL